MSKSTVQGVDVKRQVLDAALEIIATDGPDQVSMREVARRSGVSHQAPYHHFGDRAGIFAAISTEGFAHLSARFTRVLGSEDHPARGCFEAYVRTAMERPAHFRVMFRRDLCGLDTHEAALLAADEAYSELQRMVERTIGLPSGDRDAGTWASLLWATAHGLATLIVDGPLENKLPEGVDLHRHIDDVITLMTEMVESQAARMGLSPMH